MNSSKIDILEFPSNLGLKKTDFETEPGVKKLPAWLEKYGFHEQVNPERILKLEPPKYSMVLDEESGIRNVEEIIEYAIRQSKLLVEQLATGTFKIIIGGDCSILIGTSIALKQKGNFGLFFLDGHTDFILPEGSQTGGAAGMDLAIVTGHGHDKLTNILDQKPYFKEKNIFCVGNREYDKEYVQPILESDIKYFDLKRLRNNGLAKTAGQFLELVRKNNLDGFFIHLDVDVLSDTIMPAVDSREIDGLTYKEFSELLIPLFSSEKAVGIQITILNPDLDRDGKYTRAFIKNFANILIHRTMKKSELLRMDNVGIVVESLDKAISFFTEIGLKLEGRGMVEGEWAGQVTGLGNQSVEIAMMVTPDGHSRLELSRFLTPPVIADHRKAPVNALGYLRAMFTVDNIDELVSRLTAQGAELVGEVVQYENSYKLCYIRGTEGLLVGLAEELGSEPPPSEDGSKKRAWPS